MKKHKNTLQENTFQEDTFTYRLNHAMKIRGMRNADIIAAADKLGFKVESSAISQWKNGRYSPKQDNIYLLSRILSVPSLWLMGITPFDDITGETLGNWGNPAEEEILTMFRQLNPKGKEMIKRMLQIAIKDNEYIEK